MAFKEFLPKMQTLKNDILSLKSFYYASPDQQSQQLKLLLKVNSHPIYNLIFQTIKFSSSANTSNPNLIGRESRIQSMSIPPAELTSALKDLSLTGNALVTLYTHLH